MVLGVPIFKHFGVKVVILKYYVCRCHTLNRKWVSRTKVQILTNLLHFKVIPEKLQNCCRILEVGIPETSLAKLKFNNINLKKFSEKKKTTTKKTSSPLWQRSPTM